MDNRIEIRPIISAIDRSKNSTPIEQFQNETLRPILKLQNELLQKFFLNNLREKNIDWFNLPKLKRKKALNDSFKNDAKFKNAITHLIIGHFTVEEFEYFEQHQKDFKKRISKMAEQRLANLIII